MDIVHRDSAHEDLMVGLMEHTRQVRLDLLTQNLDAALAEIEVLRAENDRLRLAASFPAEDSDIQAILQALAALTLRLHPDTPTLTLPYPLQGTLSRAQELVASERAWGWRNPVDGTLPLTYKAIAERLGCRTERARSLVAYADWRRRRRKQPPA